MGCGLPANAVGDSAPLEALLGPAEEPPVAGAGAVAGGAFVAESMPPTGAQADFRLAFVRPKESGAKGGSLG